MHDYLKKILDNKKIEIENLYKNSNLSLKCQNKKSFKSALKNKKISIIAEIKRKSPSAGAIDEIENPNILAKRYVDAGANAISILTDQFAFGGKIEDLEEVSHFLKNQPIPILRKDFILDEIQMIESLNAGANAILLIVSILKEKTEKLIKSAKNYNLDVLVEVHDREELDYALSIGSDIIGINNRNLSTFEINPRNAVNLKPYIPKEVISIAESGILTPENAKIYIDAHFDALLIGEGLVKSNNPKKFIESIRE